MPWTKAGSIPQLYISGDILGDGIASAVVGRYLYLFGGNGYSGNPYANIWSLPLSEDGINGKAVLAGKLPSGTDIAYGNACVYKDRFIYVTDGVNVGTPVFVYEANADGVLKLRQSVPQPLTIGYNDYVSLLGVIVDNAYYLVSATAGAPPRQYVFYMAPIGADGLLGPFKKLSFTIPKKLQATATGYGSISTDGQHIYLVGGWVLDSNDPPIASTRNIICIDVPAIGQLQNPRIVGYVPVSPKTATGISYQGSCVFRGRKLVVAGGHETSGVNFYSATWSWDINGNGSLGPAIALSSYPDAIADLTLVEDPQGRVLGIGGFNSAGSNYEISSIYQLTDLK